MSFEISTASNYTDLLDRIDAFLTTNGKAFDPTFTGVGNGKISAWDGTPTSVAETWTITATSATDFTVSGSTSGAMAAAIVGTPYDNGKIKFLLTAGATPFSVGDIFKINTCPKWTRMVKETSNIRNAPYAVWKAPGNDGTQNIYMGIGCYFDIGSDYYNLHLTWLTGYDAGTHNLGAQPGAIPSGGGWILPGIGLWNASMPYWLCANGQMVRFCAKVSTTYQHGYLGLLKSYVNPNSWPLPIFVGGSFGYQEAKRFSDSTVQCHAYWRGYDSNDPSSQNRHSGYFRLPTGAILGMYGHASSAIESATSCQYLAVLHPWAAYQAGASPMLNQRECLDGSYLQRPITLLYDSLGGGSANGMPIGEFDGVYAIPGYAQSAENTLTRGQIVSVVLPNVFRNSQDNFCAFALN